jgi:23S rRNA (cytosine1962-C5)-methyltransferase
MTAERWLSVQEADQLKAGFTDVYRLMVGKNYWIDRYADVAVISAHKVEEIRELLGRLQGWASVCGIQFSKILGRILVHQAGPEDKPWLLFPERAEPDAVQTTLVREDGLQYEVDPGGGYSTGFFPDQRANRKYLRKLKPKKVLNLFSYTCAFSVAAAVEGAKTDSIDLSAKALKRGRANFERNGLSLEGHRFLKADVMRRLPGLRTGSYDAVILDPPTFSRGEKGRIFRAVEAFPQLISWSLSCLSSRGALLVSTNCEDLTVARLRELALQAAEAACVQVRLHRVDPPPGFSSGPFPANFWMLKGATALDSQDSTCPEDQS